MASLRNDQKSLIGAAVLVGTLMFLPWTRIALLPVVYLNTHIHELCHALAAIATGGRPDKIMVFADGSGVTPILGGSLLVITAAGYVGSIVLGSVAILSSRSARGAGNTLFLGGAALALSMALLVRGDSVGVISGIAWSLSLLLISRKLKGPSLVFSAQFLGIMQCVNAIQSMLVLLKITTIAEVQSDAQIMADNSALPAWFWAGSWALLSLIAMAVTLERAWKAPKAT